VSDEKTTTTIFKEKTSSQGRDPSNRRFLYSDIDIFRPDTTASKALKEFQRLAYTTLPGQTTNEDEESSKKEPLSNIV